MGSQPFLTTAGWRSDRGATPDPYPLSVNKMNKKKG